MAAIILTMASGCNKNSTGTGNQFGCCALLKEMVTVGYDSSGGIIDSSIVQIGYNADSQIVQTFQIEIINTSGVKEIDSFTTTYSYSDSLISSEQQLITTQSDVPNLQPTGIDDLVNTTFHASGGQITYFVQAGTSMSYGINPPQNGVTRDSGLVTYNANGSVATYDTYQSFNGAAYSPVFNQTFSYSGNNLAGYVLTNTDPSAPGTTIATYTYNGAASAAPFYNVIPGITLPSSNQVSELTLVQTGGLYPGQTTYKYTTSTYVNDQPINAYVTVNTTVTNGAYLLLTPATETITYNY